MTSTSSKKRKSIEHESKDNNHSRGTRRENGTRLLAEKYCSRKIGTWNIHSLQGKEKELNEEFMRRKWDITGKTETKVKGRGTIELNEGNVLIYSGVDKVNKAIAGVGCIIDKQIRAKLSKWQAWSERIMTVEFKVASKDWKTFIIVYAPNEDEKAEVKNLFWEELTLIMEVCRGKVFVIGDFNGRVGRADDVYGEVVGKHGEDIRNNNGRRLLEFSQLNNLIITNTFYSHKNIHKYTREVPSRNEKSIIDYILVQRDNRRAIKDVKVRRGAKIGSSNHKRAQIGE